MLIGCALCAYPVPEQPSRCSGARIWCSRLARAQWVALETRDALPRQELAALLRDSYQLVLGKLPKKIQATLGKREAKARTTNRGKKAAAKPSKRRR